MGQGWEAAGAAGPPLYAGDLPVLGVPVRFETNAAELLAGVEEAYGAWRMLRPELLQPSPTQVPRVRLWLEPADDAAEESGPIDVRVLADGRLVLSGPAASGTADLRTMEAVGRIRHTMLLDTERFRYTVLDTLTLFLLTHLDRQPLHAAAVGRRGVGLVLAGRSGTGKSTLAYLAHRAGLRVLSDDAVYLQLEPKFRVWAMQRCIHLPADARGRFAELSHLPITRPRGGRPKIAVDLAPKELYAVPPLVEHAGLCLLQRNAGPATCEPMDTDEAVAYVMNNLEGGFAAFRTSIEPRIRRLARGGAWRLNVGDDASNIAQFLYQLLDAVEGNEPLSIPL